MKNIFLTFLVLFVVNIGYAQIGFQQNVVIDETFGVVNPNSVISADIDGDGLKDVVSTGNNELVWFKNLGNENFSTLVVALKAAGLVETLSSEGPFTVFAPTNDAFGKLPEGTVATLVEPENKEKLASILTYHVVSGEFMAADVVNAISDNDGSFTIPTVQGEELVATLEGEKRNFN